MRASQSNCQH